MQEVERLCDEVVVVAHGRTVEEIRQFTDVFSAIKNNDRVGLILFTDQVEKFGHHCVAQLHQGGGQFVAVGEEGIGDGPGAEIGRGQHVARELQQRGGVNRRVGWWGVLGMHGRGSGVSLQAARHYRRPGRLRCRHPLRPTADEGCDLLTGQVAEC